ncbi:PREDICTED: protein argonaute 2-like [Ipomoea nil]|uniref:protein argonaute 2-like n=1 Tax=Ipomoea nil TaxID=35883 RepID=UPI0009011163|nr:PREDICTED: protein argonaute 2-like [Ipomoea nil]
MAGDIAMDDELIECGEETYAADVRSGGGQSAGTGLRQTGEGMWRTGSDGRSIGCSERNSVENVHGVGEGGGKGGGQGWQEALIGEVGRGEGGGRGRQHALDEEIGRGEGGGRGRHHVLVGEIGRGEGDDVGGLGTDGGGGCGVYAGRGGYRCRGWRGR